MQTPESSAAYVGYPLVTLTQGEARLLLGLLTNPDLAFTDIEYVDRLKAKLLAVVA